MKIDDIDLKILHIISDDPRISYRNISKKINITTPTVIDRIKKMEKTGIIRGYFTNVNIEYLNQYKEIFLLDLKDDLPEDLIQNKYVKKVLKLNGNKYLITFIYNKNSILMDFLKFLDEKGIEYERYTILKEEKTENEFISDDITETKLFCDYCGGEIKGKEFVIKMEGELKHFCCRACKNDYIKRYNKLKEMVKD